MNQRQLNSLVKQCLALVVLGFLAHGLLLFTDFILWDGYWCHSELQTGEGRAAMQRLFSEVGRPLDYYYYLPLGQVPGPTFPKFASLLLWITIPVPLMVVLRKGMRLPSDVAFATSALFAVSPAFDVLGEIAVWMMVVSLFFFWWGLAVLVTTSSSRGFPRVAGRVFSAVLLLLSFNLNSLLVFFYAVAAALLVSHLAASSGQGVVRSTWLSVIKYSDLALLPVLFWVLKLIFTPVHGYYKDYNQPVFSLQRMIDGSVSLTHFLLGEAVELLASWWAVGLALMAALVLARKLQWSSAISGESSYRGERIQTTAAVMISSGVILLVAAVFPYAVVNQGLASFGWLSRNCVLMPLPIALLVCGVYLGINLLIVPHRPRMWLLPVVVLVVLSVFVSNRNYLDMQALGAKQDSIAMKLQSAIDQSGAVVVQMRDYFLIPDTIYYYAPVIWTYIAAGDKPNPETFVFDTAQSIPHEERQDESGRTQIMFPQVPVTSQALDQMLEQTTMPYMLQSIPRSGPQIMFIVQQGKYGNDGVVLGARYLWLKWFNRGALPEFLEGLTITHLLELPNVGPA